MNSFCRYLASGEPLSSIVNTFLIGKTTASIIISETCSAIWTTLKSIFLRIPDESEWEEMSKEFLEKWHFPHCILVIDGKHILIQVNKFNDLYIHK